MKNNKILNIAAIVAVIIFIFTPGITDEDMQLKEEFSTFDLAIIPVTLILIMVVFSAKTGIDGTFVGFDFSWLNRKEKEEPEEDE